MEHPSKNMSCRYCQRNFELKGIIQHGVQSKKCKKFFSQAQIAYLKDYSKRLSEEKHKVQMALRYQHNKKIISEQQIINELENGNSFKNVSCIFSKFNIYKLYISVNC